MLFIANGLLSAISDNVFVATIYITEVKQAFLAGQMSREHFDVLAVAINTRHQPAQRGHAQRPGGLPVPAHLGHRATDSAVLRAHGSWMALPYTVVMGGLGWWAVSHWL